MSYDAFYSAAHSLVHVLEEPGRKVLVVCFSDEHRAQTEESFRYAIEEITRLMEFDGDLVKWHDGHIIKSPSGSEIHFVTTAEM